MTLQDRAFDMEAHLLPKAYVNLGTARKKSLGSTKEVNLLGETKIAAEKGWPSVFVVYTGKKRAMWQDCGPVAVGQTVAFGPLTVSNT